MKSKDKTSIISKRDQNIGFTILDKGTVIEGDLITERNIKLNGCIKGSCTSQNKVIISAQCDVEGSIKGQSVEVYGKVRGDINATELLYISGSASIDGNCITKKIKIDEGAIIQGYINKPDNKVAVES